MTANNPDNQLYPAAAYRPADVERDSTGVPRSLAAALTLGGALGALGAGPAELPRVEVAVAAVGSASCAALGVLAARAPAPWVVLARRAPREFAAATIATAALSTAAGGGHETPAYFPAVLLTAVGSGVVATSERNAVRAAAPGVGVAVCYLLGAARTRRRTGTFTGRAMAVSGGHAAAFPVSAVVGAVAGLLSLRGRSLADYLARQAEDSRTGASKQEIDRAAAAIRRDSEAVLAVLGQIADRFAEDTAVEAATSQMSTALSTLRGAGLRLQLDDESEALGSWQRLRANIEQHNERLGDVRTVLRSDVDEDEPLAAETVATLLDCATALIQNSAEAARRSDRVADVHVTLSRREDAFRPRWGRPQDAVVMVIEDDAGGTAIPPKSDWGRGLSTCDYQTSLRDGTFRPEVAGAGLRFVIELPWARSGTSGARPLTFTRRYVEDLERSFANLRVLTCIQALLFAAGRRDTPRRWQIMVPLAAALAAEAADRRADARVRHVVETAAGLAAISPFRGPERPPAGGFAALMALQIAARGRRWEALASASAQTALALWLAGERRWSSDEDGAVADRVFPLLCAAIGVGVNRGFRAVQAEEERLGGEAWRRSVLFDLALPGRDEHHFLKPLIAALGPQRWQLFGASELGGALAAARKPLISQQFKLEQLMRRGDPLRSMQHQLARMFAPAPVKVYGQPPVPRDPGDGHELDAVAFRVGLVGLGLEVAERVRKSLPRGAGLRELRLHVADHEPHTEIEIVQVPMHPVDDLSDAALDAAARRAGGFAQVGGSRHRVYVHSSAFW